MSKYLCILNWTTSHKLKFLWSRFSVIMLWRGNTDVCYRECSTTLCPVEIFLISFRYPCFIPTSHNQLVFLRLFRRQNNKMALHSLDNLLQICFELSSSRKSRDLNEKCCRKTNLHTNFHGNALNGYKSMQKTFEKNNTAPQCRATAAKFRKTRRRRLMLFRRIRFGAVVPHCNGLSAPHEQLISVLWSSLQFMCLQSIDKTYRMPTKLTWKSRSANMGRLWVLAYCNATNSLKALIRAFEQEVLSAGKL